MLIYLETLETDEERDKFTSIYLQYRKIMIAVAIKILKNRDDAEDAVHNAFLSIAKNLDKISRNDCEKTRSYIVIITERKAIDIFRERNKYSGIELNEDDVIAEAPLPGDGGLADAIARLPERYREVLILRFADGYSSKEVAKLLDMNVGAVDMLVSRARARLREELGKEEVPE